MELTKSTKPSSRHIMRAPRLGTPHQSLQLVCALVGRAVMCLSHAGLGWPRCTCIATVMREEDVAHDIAWSAGIPTDNRHYDNAPTLVCFARSRSLVIDLIPSLDYIHSNTRKLEKSYVPRHQRHGSLLPLSSICNYKLVRSNMSNVIDLIPSLDYIHSNTRKLQHSYVPTHQRLGSSFPLSSIYNYKLVRSNMSNKIECRDIQLKLA